MTGSPHVLIIESEYLISWHLSELLQEWGYTVTEWRNRQPLYLTPSHQQAPNLILLNPKFRKQWANDGLLEVFLLTWNAPVILLSNSLPSIGWLRQVSASSLSKPFTAYQLRKRLEETLGF